MSPRKPKSALRIQPGVEQPSSVNKDLITKQHSKNPHPFIPSSPHPPTSLPPYLPTSQLINGILSGNRTLLAKAITLVESNRPDHQKQAQEIINECLKHAKSEVRSQKLDVEVRSLKEEVTSGHPASGHPASGIRIGITGAPGVGKSTFIESLGKHLTGKGHKVAVLAVDPSSTLSKGSILGDKTRMESLAVDPNAFIRPSPAAGTLGGVARKTRESIYLCEAAGFDVIFVETVGVGQSETSVKSMTDFFLLLMLAGAGDELQGIKRGIIEMADAIFINKADGNNIDRARIAQRDFSSAIHLFPPSQTGWTPVVDICSAVTGEGIARVWETIRRFHETTTLNGQFHLNRTGQNRHAFLQTIDERLKERFYRDPETKKRMAALEKQVAQGILNPYLAATRLFDPGSPMPDSD